MLALTTSPPFFRSSTWSLRIIFFLLWIHLFAVQNLWASALENSTFKAYPKLERISVKDGRLIYPNGKEVNLWGVNFQPSLGYCYERFVQAGLMPKDDFDENSYFAIIDEGLDEIQTLGCEIIRVTLSPHELTHKDGSLKSTQHLRCLDYLMYQCRKRGLYYYFAFMNELGAKSHNIKDTIMESDDREHKISYYEWMLNPRFIQLTKTYIENLLNYPSAFDGIQMIQDPAFCMAELINEPHTPNEDDPSQSFHRYYQQWLNDKGEMASAELFQQWREDYTLDYINDMVDFFKNIGCKAPVSWSLKWSMAITHNNGDAEWKAALQSKAPIVCFSTYPTQGTVYEYVHDKSKDLRKLGRDHNALPYLKTSYKNRNMQGWANEKAFRSKAHYVYEWETHANMTSYMYPAMAKYFRAQGAQIATMWTYILPKLSNFIAAQHILNLKSTPSKSASFMAAKKVFKEIPLYSPYSTTASDADYFQHTAVDFNHQISAYAKGENLIHSGPLPPEYIEHLFYSEASKNHIKKIVGVGSSPWVKYEGNGMYILDMKSYPWLLEIYPDVQWLRDPNTGGKMLNSKGEAPLEDDPLYDSHRQYYETMFRYRRQISNVYHEDRYQSVEIHALNLPPNPMVLRLDGKNEHPVKTVSTNPLKMIVKPGRYIIRSAHP
jgi:hypothetical protein